MSTLFAAERYATLVVEPEYLTVQEVAELLRVDPETVRRWLRDKKLRGVNFGRGRAGWRVHRPDLEAFIRQRSDA